MNTAHEQPDKKKRMDDGTKTEEIRKEEKEKEKTKIEQGERKKRNKL